MRRSNLFVVLFFSFLIPHFPFVCEAATDLEPIVVRHAQDSVLTTAVLTASDIARAQINTPEDALARLGVDVQSRGLYGVKSDISLNASTFQQVLILVNGVRVKDSQTAHHDLDLFFTIEDIERVEVIPAAAAAKYGPDAIGGAVNFVLKKPKTRKNTLSAAFGRNETFEEALSLSYAALGARHSSSVANAQSNGPRFDSEFRTSTFFHSTQFEREHWGLSVNAGYNEKEFGAFDFYTPYRGFASKEWTNTKFIDSRLLLRAQGFTVEPFVNFRQHQDKFMLTVTNPSLYLNHHTTDTFETGLRLERPFGRHLLGLTAAYGEESIHSNNLGSHARGHWSFLVDPTYRLDETMTLGAVLRLDRYTTFGEELSGSVSWQKLLSQANKVYCVLGRTIRVPTFTELYYSDPTTSSDPGLKPEHAISFETGWSGKPRENVGLEFSFFIRQEYDTIDFTKLTSADTRFAPRNISEALTQGINLFASWRLDEKVGLDLRYRYANKDPKDNGVIYKYGLNYAKHFIDLGFDYDLGRFHNRCDVVVKKKPLRDEWIVVNDRITFDLREGVEIFGEAYNLFNVEYQDVDGVPQTTRLFKIGVKFNW